MLYEIRNYHFDPARLPQYKQWANSKALPFLQRELDLVGFWVNTDSPPQVLEAETNNIAQDELKSANITWIIRWSNRETRDETMARVFSGEEWKGIFSTVPGGLASYFRREAKFTESLL
ncbi:MAG: hypothetical protein GXP16_05665 [Gammaproteobacteria bacterium]|nr:hypothetical protein [Gammaproteobacteria bacterium]